MRQRWGGRALPYSQAQGILLATLDILAAFGYRAGAAT